MKQYKQSWPYHKTRDAYSNYPVTLEWLRCCTQLIFQLGMGYIETGKASVFGWISKVMMWPGGMKWGGSSLVSLYTALLCRNFIPQFYTAILYRIFIPQFYTAFLYRTFMPQFYTAFLYRNFIPHFYTAILYRNFIPHFYTAFYTAILYRTFYTPFLYRNFIPHFYTAILYPIFIPHFLYPIFIAHYTAFLYHIIIILIW